MKVPNRIFIFFVLVVTVFLSCTTTENSVKEKPSVAAVWWADFVTFFNVYYNADKQYETAQTLIYKASVESGIEINSVFPVSTKRGSIGTKELNSAISKCTAILQNHPESDLADDALLLMGKSYYYLGDLPPAERKFNEILSNYPTSQNIFESTLFLARTYLEQNKTENGLSILNELINRDDVPDRVKGEANLILGDRYYFAGQYDDAYPFLQHGTEEFDDNEAISRAFYLMAKINSIHGDFVLALTNLKSSKSASQIPANWYWVGVQTIHTYITMNQFDDAQNELNNLLDNDDLLFYRKNFILEQARIYLAKGEFETAEKSYKEFIVSNQSSAQAAQLIPYAYLDLADLRTHYKPDIEIARYFYEQAAKGNQQDSLIIKAKEKERLLKNYLTLKLEYYDLKSKIGSGIVMPDTNQVAVTDSLDSIDDVPLAKKNRLGKEEEVDEGEKTIVSKNQRAKPQTTTQNRPQYGDEDNGNSFRNNTSVSNQNQTKEVILDDDALSEKFIAPNYASKYSVAKDSLSLANLRNVLENQYEKIIEYFYFQSVKMDSVIKYANLFAEDYPDSKKNARILYAKSIAYQNLNDTVSYHRSMMKLTKNYSDSKFGLEAKSKLGLVDSSEAQKKQLELMFKSAIAKLEKKEIDSSRSILKYLETKDSTLTIYPNILYALGYISEKYDKNWNSASAYYTKIQKKYAATKIGKELADQFAIINPAKEVERQTTQDKNSVAENSNTPQNQTGNPAVNKPKQGETKFVINSNLPPRFKRQPKLADVSW